jgi:hypothetical protein
VASFETWLVSGSIRYREWVTEGTPNGNPFEPPLVAHREPSPNVTSSGTRSTVPITLLLCGFTFSSPFADEIHTNPPPRATNPIEPARATIRLVAGSILTFAPEPGTASDGDRDADAEVGEMPLFPPSPAITAVRTITVTTATASPLWLWNATPRESTYGLGLDPVRGGLGRGGLDHEAVRCRGGSVPGGQGKAEVEGRTLLEAAFEPDVAASGIHEVFRDVQAEAPPPMRPFRPWKNRSKTRG